MSEKSFCIGDQVQYIPNGKPHWLDNRYGRVASILGDVNYEVLFGREQMLWLASGKNLKRRLNSQTPVHK